MAQPTQIRNPRRLLILAPTSHSPSTIPPFLHTLTGVPVTAATFAGYTTHPPLRLQNKYYTADVPIWVDEIPLDADPRSSSSSSSSEFTSPSTTNPTEEKAAVTPAQWKTEFSSPEAQVVRDAIGALVICVRNIEAPSAPPVPPAGSEGECASPPAAEDVDARADVRALKDFLRAVGAVRALIEDERGGVDEMPAVVVLVGRTETSTAPTTATTRDDDSPGLDGNGDEDRPFSVPWWEDQLLEMDMVGVEVVAWDPRAGEEAETRNQFGEYQGMRRVREVLETHQWAAAESDEKIDDDDDDELERQLLALDEDAGFDWEVGELEREMVGLRFAMERGEEFEGEGEEEGDGDERRVESVEALLLRMQAIRDMSDELPEQERKRFAARAVRDIMKEL
ncbi:alpha and gamma adaptin binding protein p34-domain-containing protein [Aspergillus floccosus]